MLPPPRPPTCPARRQVAADGSEVTFNNNELGFSGKNVMALCSMGESTKK